MVVVLVLLAIRAMWINPIPEHARRRQIQIRKDSEQASADMGNVDCGHLNNREEVQFSEN